MNNNWISVTNEPKVDQWIFIYIGASNPVMGCYKGNGKVLDNSLNDIWDFKEDGIKFWQPLPLPPTEESKPSTKQDVMPVLSDESLSAEIFKKEPVNFLMVNAMLYLNEEQLIELRDKLIARTSNKNVFADEQLKKEFEEVNFTEEDFMEERLLPNLAASTANFSKIEDKDKWLDEVGGREND